MTLPPISVTELRYLKEDLSLSSERLIIDNYFLDHIKSHGIDAVYFRKHNSFYDSPSGATCNYVYGENPVDPITLSANIVLMAEVLSDDFLTNHLGIQNTCDINFFIHCRDFDENFRDLLGVPTGSMMTTTLTGGLTGFTGYVSGSFSDGNISGITSAWLDLSGVSGSFSQPYSGTDVVGYTIVNPNIKFYSVFEYARALTGAMSGSYAGSVDASGNGSLTGTASSQYRYFAPPAASHGPGWEYHIPPQAGDFVRIQFHHNNPEEFELTQVANRVIDNSGLNPLLEIYVWKCNAVRRDPSRELMSGGEMPQEPLTTDKTELKDTMAAISDAIFDYAEQPVDAVDGVDSDSVYGKY